MVYAGENRYVSNNNDAGAGSLRQALLDSRSGSSVTFDPAFFLPTAQRQILLQSDLPVVSLDIAIDASNAGVSLDDGAFLPASGLLVFTGNGASVMGIHFNGSGRDAIAITGGYTAVGGSGAGEGNVFTGITRYAIHYASTSAGTTTVRGNHIGVNKSFADGNNGDHGIYVNGTGSITIGGTSTGAAAPSINEGNFIGYHDAGSKAAILVQDGSPVILGNYIGTNRAGIFLGNDNAVAIGANADGVVLGAATYGQGNVIGQNNDIAVWFEASGGSHFIRGNYIGTTYDAGVWRDLEPGNHGLLINGTGSLTVGGVNTGGTGPTSLNEGNYFAFHSNGALASMFIADGSPVIKGNYIGTNRVGANLGNDIGVYISSGTDGLSFGGTGYGEGNVLGFSTNYQMWFLCNTGSHTIKGNFIGTTYDAGTWRDLGPTNHGINIDGSGTLAIGGVCTGGTGPQSLNEGNYIAFHDTAAKAGIYIHSGSHSIKGNFLGTNRAGADLGNTYGIQMAAGSMNTTIGGTAYGEGNVLGGSDGYQIYYQSTAGGTSVIKGNFIGVTHDAGVWRDLGAADHGIYANGTSTLTIGGTCTGGVGPQGIHEGNYIAFHNTAGKAGIFVSQGIPGIKGNYIGSNRAGANLGNAYGINLSDAVGNIVVGSATYGQGNVIGFSANTGIYHNCDAGSQTIIGNYIGVTHDHILGGPNSWLALTQTNGIELADLNGSTLTVGGAAAGEGNYIGCGTYGIVAVTKTHLNVYGNTIGTDNTHTLDFGTTSNSIYIALTAGNTMTIGGAGAGQGNLIAYSDGYAIRAESALFNVETLVVAGNYIGTDATGRNLGGGGSTGGIYADSGYTVTVGGATSAHGNVIGGTLGTQGIYLASGLTSAVIQNNFVGVTRDGTSLSAGSATGIFVASDSTITGNTVGNFTGEGIQLGAGSHTLKSNLIGTHASGAAHGNGTGVRILAAAGSVAIGGTGAGEGNRINNNTTYGIRNDSADVGHTIRSNLIGVAEGGAAAPNGTASLYTTTGTIAFGNTSGRRNNIHGVEGQKAIHQTGGTLAFAGVNYVSGDMLSTGGTSTVANQLVLTGSVTGFFSGGLGFTTITLIGSRPQTLGAINNFFSLQYNGTSYHNMTGYSTNFLTVQSGMAVVKNGTLTMKSGDPFGINVGAAVGKTAVLSFDNATLTSTAPGTTRHAININARGDLRATKTVFNSLWNKGIVFATGSRLGGNTTFDNGTANFRHVTFDNVTADCVAMDVSALTAADAGSFPDLLRDIRFNGNVGATNVKSGASTPRIDFSVTTGNFGTIGTDGKSAEDDAAGVINWFIGVFVDTVTDVDDGNTASVAALTAAPGADGKISLREAIKAVNNNVDENVIVFSPTVFPVSAQGKITVGSALPTLTHALTRVDGRNAGVTLDGTGLAGGESGLTFNATGCDIKGLRITNFPGSGILVSGGSLQVGGPGSDDGLVIGGVLDGIRFQSAAATASSVRGCWIGVNKSGQDLGSTGHGIYVNGSAPLTIGGSASGEGNHIGFHDSVGMAGLYVNDGSVTLQGNRIGTSSTGDRWGNATGVWLAAGADAVVLGGTQSGEGNSIAGNTGTGLRVASTYAVGSGTQVLGNMIGRRTDGTPVSHANGGHGIQIDAGAGLVTLGSASEKAPNQIAGSKGQQALEQSGGTLNFAGTVSVDGAMTFAGGSAALGSVKLSVSGDLTRTGGVVTAGTSSVTLDGTGLQSLTSIPLASVYHNGSGTARFADSTTITTRLMVESGAVTAGAVTLTFSAGAEMKIGGLTRAVVSLDGATLTSTSPGVDRWVLRVQTGGDLHARMGTLFNSLSDAGLVMDAGSALGTGQISGFSFVTFDNIGVTGVGLDLSSLTSADNNQLPDFVSEVRFNGSGINVKAAVNTPQIVLRIYTGNFGTLSANGVSGEQDPGNRVVWGMNPASSLVLVSVTYDQTVNAEKIYFTFNSQLLPGSTTLADWILLGADGITNLKAGATLTILNNQLIVSLAAGKTTVGGISYAYTGTGLSDVYGNLASYFGSGFTPTVTGGATPTRGPPGFFMISLTVSDPDGSSVTLDVTLVSGPQRLPLTDAAQQSVPITADGTYVFAATVTDNTARTSQKRFNVTVDNVAPLASVPSLVDARIGDVVTLDGSSSKDGNGAGDIVNARWICVSGPALPSLTHDGVTGVATFDSTGRPAGIYRFALNVTDNNSATATARLWLRLQGSNLIPLADAGVGGRSNLSRGSFTLRGHESVDPEGTALSYGWAQTSGPRGVLSNASAASPTFTPSAGGRCVFSLVVTDAATQTSLPAEVTWLVDDDKRDIIAPNAVLSPSVVVSQDTTVTLDGSSSADAFGRTLTYQWAQTSGPAVSLDGSTKMKPQVRLHLPGSYTFSLVVSNDHLPSVAATKTIFVVQNNSPPTAHAGNTIKTTVGQWVTLDGSGSRDPNGGVLHYRWTQKEGPAVSFDATAVRPTFVVTKSRVYTFELVVTDGEMRSSPSTVRVRVNGANTVPEAFASNNGQRAVTFDGLAKLEGGLSKDGDGQPLAFINWVQTSGPPALLHDPESLETTFPVYVEGFYTFDLYVDDGQDRSLPDSVTIHVKGLGRRSGAFIDDAPGCLLSHAGSRSSNIPWLHILVAMALAALALRMIRRAG